MEKLSTNFISPDSAFVFTMKIRHLVAALAVAIAAQGVSAQAPKREFRSIWMAAMGIDWPRTAGTSEYSQATAKQELITYLDNYKKHNFNGICLHVRPLADALYKSTLEPWSPSVSGKRGVDPGWDPLEFAVEECHKRGIEIYAWINPFRINASGDLSSYTTPQDKEWVDNGWTMYANKWTVFNPAVEGARKHCMDVMEEIWTNYQIDGMLFDDYFYPGNGISSNESAPDYELYKATRVSDKQSIGDWRRENVNSFVRELYARIQAQRPDMRFGIGPAGVGGGSASKYKLPRPSVRELDWMYDKIYCDPLAWLNDGSIDFIAPQIYWATTHPSAPFKPLCEWWTMVGKHFGRHNYISMASYKVDSDEFGGNNAAGGWAQIATQVELCREDPAFNAPGQIYYSAKYFDGPTKTGLGQYLEENSYTAPALVPVVDWKERVNYAAPAGATLDGSTLRWTPTEVEGRAIMRYTVYAVPLNVRAHQAEAADGDGIDGQYLLGVTYDPSYTVPADRREGFWYAVCTYDGYGYESTPAYVNYEGNFSQTPVPTTPADGAKVNWDTKFSWTGSANATFKIQIASDKSFRHLVYENAKLDKPEVEVDLSILDESTQFFWRVLATEPDCLTSMSDVFTFTTPARADAEPVTLLTPANGVTIETADVKFSWTPVAGVDTYTVEVAKDDNFDSPMMSRTIDASMASLEVRTASFGLGTFAWRVIAGGSRVHPSTSAVSTFTVENLSVGANEIGYEIALDPTQYESVDGYTLESLWMRSVEGGNLAFDADGAMNRSMVATPERVYVSGRTGASADAIAYLREYSAETGEHLRDINLAPEASIGYYPCNGVIKDSQNNICVHNLTLNCATTPLVIHAVNTVTGELTEIARLTTSEEDAGRIDHVAIFGDINSDRFCVFAALSNKPVVVRWVIRPDNPVTYTAATMQDFYPASAQHFGIAPMVLPVSERGVYVDGSATAATYYNFSNQKASGSFASAPEAAPDDVSNNGMARFKTNGKELFAYNSVSHTGGVRYTISQMSSKEKFNNMKPLWTLPTQGLGSVNSSTFVAPMDAVVSEDGQSATLFVYAPGNGLAAYRITYDLGVEDALAAGDSDWHIEGLSVVFDRPCATLTAYTVTGATVAVSHDADCITLPCPGTYIIATPEGNHLVSVK